MNSKESNAILEKAAKHWSEHKTDPKRLRWWQSPAICRHINMRFSGVAAEGTHGGDIELLRKISEGVKFESGVSVGCGNGFHELKLLEAGIVEHFTLFEISQTRADQAWHKASLTGLGHRVSVRVADAFSEPALPQYDLVYWKDALHHMLDARAAVHWSWRMLKPGGVFFANDFVGPAYMQYTDRQLDLAEKVRLSLPEKYLVDPVDRSRLVPVRRRRPNLKSFLEIDPTECADSENIVPSIRELFPGATVFPTGGIVYMLALNDILANIHEDEDATLLRSLMLADDLCIEAGETLYSVAHGRR